MFSKVGEEGSRRQKELTTGIFAIVLIVLFICLVALNQPQEKSTMLVTQLEADSVLVTISTDYSRLNDSSQNKNSNQLQTLRDALRTQPNNEKTASLYAEHALSLYRESGDVRYYGYARGALEPWWQEPSPPPAIWLLRGRLLQSNHEFQEAAQDLKRYVKKNHTNTEAYLLLADAWKRSGDIDQARHACLNVALSGRPILGQYCAIEIRLSVGQFDEALEHGISLAKDINKFSESEKQWALSIIAEAATASGQYEQALNYYKLVLDNTDDLVAKLNYADTLIKLERFDEAIDILPKHNLTIPVLHRQTIASKNKKDIHNKAIAELLKQLQDPLLSSDDFLKEKTIHQLQILNNPNKALAMAKRNWVLQKAWEDAALLLDTAKSHSDKAFDDAVLTITNWRQQWLGDPFKA